MLPLLLYTSIGCYVLSILAGLGHVVFQGKFLLRGAHRLALGGLLLHSIVLISTFYQSGYPFIHSDSDVYLLVGWIVIGLFLALNRWSQRDSAGILFVPAGLIFIILSLFRQGDFGVVRGGGLSPWVLIHLLLAFFAFAIFLVSFVMGIAFIIQERQIKAKHLGRFIRRWPSLEVLDRIHYKALALGLLLLTASIVLGTILNKESLGVFFTWEPKQMLVLFTWVLYTIFLQMRIGAGWRGRRGIFLSVLGFAIVVLVFFGIQHVGVSSLE